MIYQDYTIRKKIVDKIIENVRKRKIVVKTERQD